MGEDVVVESLRQLESLHQTFSGLGSSATAILPRRRGGRKRCEDGERAIVLAE